jgi:hypothetical protein
MRNRFLVEKWLVGDDHVVDDGKSIVIKLYSGFTVIKEKQLHKF